MFEEKTAAVFIDYDNLLRERMRLDSTPMQDAFFEKLREKLKVAKIYLASMIAYGNFESADLNKYFQQSTLGESGIETRCTAIRNKNCAEVQIAIDTMSMLQFHPEINTFIFISGDRDLIPIFCEVRKHQKHVIIITSSKQVSTLLHLYADDYWEYDTVVSLNIQGLTTPLDLRLQRFDTRFQEYGEEKCATCLKYRRKPNLDLYHYINNQAAYLHTLPCEIFQHVIDQIENETITIYTYEPNLGIMAFGIMPTTEKQKFIDAKLMPESAFVSVNLQDILHNMYSEYYSDSQSLQH